MQAKSASSRIWRLGSCNSCATSPMNCVPEAEFAKHLGLDHSLERDYGLDSLSRAELLLRIERELGVAPEETALSEAETPRDLLRVFGRRTGAEPRARPRPRRPASSLKPTNPRSAKSSTHPIRSSHWSTCSTGTQSATATGC